MIGIGTGAGVLQAGTRLLSLGRAGFQSIRSFDAMTSAGNLLTRAEAAREAATAGTGIGALLNAGKATALEGAAAGLVRAPGIGSSLLGMLGRGAGIAARWTGMAALISAMAEAVESAHRLDVQLQALKSTNSAVEGSLRQQIAAIRTADDAQKAMADSTHQLADARTRLTDVRREHSGVFGDRRQVVEQERSVRVLAGEQRSALAKVFASDTAPSQAERDAMQRRAAREIGLGQMEREATIGRSTGYERAELLESEAQRAEANAREAAAYDAEQARLSRVENAALANPEARLLFKDAKGRNVLGPISELLAEGRRQSSSEIMRQAQSLEDMRSGRTTRNGRRYSDTEIAEAEERFKAGRDHVLSQSPDRAIELREAANRARLEAGMQAAEISAEQKVNLLRDQGRDREEGAALAKIQALRQQHDLLDQFGDKQGAAAARPRISAAERELAILRQVSELQRRSDTAHVQAVELQQRAALAAARGRFSQAGRLRDEALRKEDAAEERRRTFELQASGEYTKEEATAQAARERAAKEQDRTAEAAIYRAQKSREIAEDRLTLTGKEADIQKLAQMRDQDTLRQRIQEGLAAHLSPEEATKFAYAQTSQDLIRSRLDFERSHVVDSLQRIGGGGGVSQDAGLDYAQRQTALLEEARNHLRQIAKGEGDAPANEARIDDGEW